MHKLNVILDRHDQLFQITCVIQLVSIVETWTTGVGERLIIDAFNIWCWRQLLKISLAVKRANVSILQELKFEIHIRHIARRDQNKL